MKTYNDNPNFSIVLPGGCNAQCSFCFNIDNDITNVEIPLVEYIKQMKYTFDNMPEKFYQVSLTGGEPLLSPYFSHVITMLSLYTDQFRKVVLTTNGSNLLGQLDMMSTVVHHVNISRHHYDDAFNKQIFKGSYSVGKNDLSTIIDRCGRYGIDVSLNCVIRENTMGIFVANYIEFSKRLGVRSVNFRRVCGSLEPTSVEKSYDEYKVISETGCPVCRTKEQIIQGVTVIWSASLEEPTEHIEEMYELIFMPDGNLYRDWAGNKPYVAVPKVEEHTHTHPVDGEGNHSFGYFESQTACEGSLSVCGRQEPSCRSSGCG